MSYVHKAHTFQPTTMEPSQTVQFLIHQLKETSHLSARSASAKWSKDGIKGSLNSKKGKRLLLFVHLIMPMVLMAILQSFHQMPLSNLKSSFWTLSPNEHYHQIQTFKLSYLKKIIFVFIGFFIFWNFSIYLIEIK